MGRFFAGAFLVGAFFLGRISRPAPSSPSSPRACFAARTLSWKADMRSTTWPFGSAGASISGGACPSALCFDDGFHGLPVLADVGAADGACVFLGTVTAAALVIWLRS
ncbi:hypothetical protein ACWGLG_29935 [Streptomyces antimycoticus]